MKHRGDSGIDFTALILILHFGDNLSSDESSTSFIVTWFWSAQPIKDRATSSILLLHTATSPHHIHVSTASLVNSKQMRKIKPSNLLRTSHHVLKYSLPTRQCPHHPPILSPCRSLAQLQTTREIFPEICFTSSSPPLRAPAEISQSTNGPPPDERTLKLGKSTSSRPPLRSRNTDKHPPQL